MNCFKNSNKGFSMIELIVSLGIMTLLITVFLANYHGGSRSSELSLSAQTMAGDIRLAQSNTLGLIKYNNLMPLGGWGIHFDRAANNRNYVIFADLNGNKVYDSGAEGNISFGARSVNLPSGVIIDSTTFGNAIDITFVPPDPITNIYNGTATTTSISITLKNSIENKTKKISVNFFGLIEVSD